MKTKLKKIIKRRLEALGIVTQYELSMSALDVAIDVATGNYIDGDYLEFGVFKGESFARAYNRFQSKKEAIQRRYFAVDSFEGLPASEEQNKPEHYTEGEYAASEDVFKNNLKKHAIDLSKVICVPGFYDQTLNRATKEKYEIEKASVVYIDVDLYESAVPVFNFLTDIVQTGTIIVIDDWFRHLGIPTAGIQKACHEWLEKNPNIKLVELHKWRRIAFIVHKI